MSVTIGTSPVIKPGRSISISRAERKVALFGSHTATLVDAPWSDHTWERWGHASSRFAYKVELDRYFDLHARSVWTRGGRKTSQYPKWLKRNTVPIYMQQRHEDVPASVEYPRRRVLQEFGYPRPYFTSQTAWMIALALTEGVTTLGLFGIEYGIESEYQNQRGGCEYWLGQAAGRGVRIVLPEQCHLLASPAKLYGYESHDLETGALLPEYQKREWKKREIIPVPNDFIHENKLKPPEELREEIELEEKEYLRPDWSLGPTGRNGQAKEA